MGGEHPIRGCGLHAQPRQPAAPGERLQPKAKQFLAAAGRYWIRLLRMDRALNTSSQTMFLKYKRTTDLPWYSGYSTRYILTNTEDGICLQTEHKAFKTQCQV